MNECVFKYKRTIEEKDHCKDFGRLKIIILKVISNSEIIKVCFEH